MNRAAVPVVLATVTRPLPRSAPAHSRVMEDLPRMPLTSTRVGMTARFASWRRCSTMPATSRPAQHVARTQYRKSTAGQLLGPGPDWEGEVVGAPSGGPGAGGVSVRGSRCGELEADEVLFAT